MEHMNKICFKCGKEKPLTAFYEHPRMPDGHVNKCKECNKLDVRQNYNIRKDQYHEYDKTRQRTSRKRMFNHRYSQIRQRVEGRAIRKYKIEGTKMLTYADYCIWLKNNMDNFEQIYKQWETSGFTRKLTPSIDRIDNVIGYVANNMRWTTVQDNSIKYTGKL